MMVDNLLLYVGSLLGIFLSARVVVKSSDRISKKLKLSTFIFSYVFLGTLTSLPEISVGINSLLDKNPDIYTGNLLGGTAVIFLLIIPLLAIFNNGITFNHKLSKKTLAIYLGSILFAFLLTIDSKINVFEGVLMILAYIIPLIFMDKGTHADITFDQTLNKVFKYKWELLKILASLISIYYLSQIVVHQTIYLSNLFKISTFYVSLVILSFGTNLPELSLAINATLNKRDDVAMGDYLGSASTNILLLGILSLFNRQPYSIRNNFPLTLALISAGIILLYIFTRTNLKLSRKQGIFLILIYLIFASTESYFSKS